MSGTICRLCRRRKFGWIAPVALPSARVPPREVFFQASAVRGVVAFAKVRVGMPCTFSDKGDRAGVVIVEPQHRRRDRGHTPPPARQAAPGRTIAALPKAQGQRPSHRRRIGPVGAPEETTAMDSANLR